MLLLVTTTKGRPKALSALEKWVKAQTTDDYHWLIVCDDPDGYKFPKGEGIKVIKRDPSNDTLPSICHNWLEAIDYIEKNDKYDQIAALEDDDYYAPGYLRETKELLKKGELVGWHEDAYYYVLSRKARRFHNVGHASLAATAFKRSVLPYLKECCQQGDVFIDLLLWKGIQQTVLMPQAPMTTADGRTITAPPISVTQIQKSFTGKTILADNFTGIVWGSREQPKMDKAGNIANEHPRHVGIKQNWHGGEEGLSSGGHDPMQGGGPDIWGDKLKQWIGEDDAKFYLAFTVEPDGPKTGKPYSPNVMLPLPIENF